MSPDAKHTIEYLKDCNHILPYATAQGFCYMNLMHFAPNYKPSYKRYFYPFRDFKHNTFYQIHDIIPYLKRHLGDTALRDFNVSGITEMIAITRILVAGLTERQCDQLAAMDNQEMVSLMQSYKVLVSDTYDVAEDAISVRINDSVLPFLPYFKESAWEGYDLQMEYPHNNILIFTLSII